MRRHNSRTKEQHRDIGMSDKLFWWEDGYVPASANGATSGSGSIADQHCRITMDDGSAYKAQTVAGVSHCLQTIFSPSGDLIISLCDTGRISCSVNVYRSSTCELLRTWSVDDKCGYMAIR